MRYVHANRLDCTDLGRRATVRVRTPDGSLTDAVGILEECDERVFVIRTKRGEALRLDRASVVAAKVIPDPPDRH
ncbi:MAG TPA: hypothetical protein VGB64_08740 [Actinomycetota bacterium]